MSRALFAFVLFLLPFCCTSVNWYNNRTNAYLTSPLFWSFTTPYNNTFLQLLLTFSPNSKTVLPSAFKLTLNSTIVQTLLAVDWVAGQTQPAVFSFMSETVYNVNSTYFIGLTPSEGWNNNISVNIDFTFVDSSLPLFNWAADNFRYYQPWTVPTPRHYSIDLSPAVLPGELMHQAFNMTINIDQVNIQQFSEIRVWNQFSPKNHSYYLKNSSSENFSPIKIVISDIGYAIWYVGLIPISPFPEDQTFSPIQMNISPMYLFYGNCTQGWCIPYKSDFLAPTVPPKLTFRWWQVVVPVGGACIVAVVWFFTLTTKQSNYKSIN